MKIVLFGAGKISDVVVSLISEQGDHEVVAFSCDPAYIASETCHGLPLVNFEEVERRYPPAEYRMIVAIGYQDLNRVRAARCAEARDKGYALERWVSRHAHVPATCTIGENCIVMPGASLQPYAVLGRNVQVWDNAVIGHHAVVEDDVYIAANATVSSSTTLGSRCFVGVNAAIGQNLSIGADCFFGAGTTTTRDTEPGGVYVASDTERHRIDSRRFARIAKLG